MHSRMTAKGVAAICALLSFAFTGCHQSDPHPARPNVLLITIDTLRADRLGCYGSATNTPNIDRLAAEGTLFEHAACPMPLTRPSHFSIFSGRYPREHGVVNNSLPLPPEMLTLTDVLKKAGYRTGGVVAVKLFAPNSGASRGFDFFDYPKLRHHRDADAVVPAAAAWLASLDRSAPFFLWVHLFDPHMPYAPPAPYAPARRSADEVPPRITWRQLISIAEQNGGDVPASVYEHALRLYQGEVEHTDHWIGKLLDALRRHSLLDQTIVVFTADHGECFERGVFFEHNGCLYDGAARVPLIVRHPSKVPRGRLPAVAEHVDIAPTILDLAGVAIPSEFRGAALFRRGSEKRHAVIQHPVEPESMVARRARRFQHLKSVKGERYRPLVARPEELAIRGTRWKYIADPSGRGELYDLAADPEERNDVAGDHPQVIAELQGALHTWLAAHPAIARPQAAPMSEELEETLRALGYVD
jgi:arylsulfatase A-like enzyme